MGLPPWALTLIQTLIMYFEGLFGQAATTPVANPSTQEEHLRAAQYHLTQATKS